MAGTNTIKQQAAGAGVTGAGQAKAALQVFAGGACYGAMATTYKLAYAAGFTSAQVVASQAWFGCLFFALATLAGHALGHRWQRVGWKWIGNTYLDDSGRDSPASLNSTGDM